MSRNETLINFDAICDTPFWNNSSIWNTAIPKLPSCFTDTALPLTSFIFLITFLPYTLWDYLTKKKSSISWNLFNVIKLVLAISLTIVCSIDVIQVAKSLFLDHDSSITTAHLLRVILNVFSHVLLTFALHLQRVYGFVNGGVVWFYLLLAIDFNVLQLFGTELQNPKPIYEYVEFGLQVVLFILCSFADRTYNEEKNEEKSSFTNLNSSKKAKDICPKEAASVPSKLTFWWFNSFAWLGYRRPLTRDDLWPLRLPDRAKHLFRHFNQYWQHATFDECPVKNVDYKLLNAKSDDDVCDINVTKPKRRTNVITIVCRQFWRYFVFPSAARFFADNLQLVNPIVIKHMIAFVSDLSAPFWHGYFYTAIFVLTNVLSSLTTGYHQHRMFVLGMRIRTCITAAIYRKALVLSGKSRTDFTTGEIVNLMAVDSQRFTELLPWLCFLWTVPFQIGLAIWLLWAELGISVLGGLLLMILFIPTQALAARYIKRHQAQQMSLKDERLRALNEMLNGIKVLKLYAWEDALVAKIEKIREQELHHLRLAGYFGTVFNLISLCSPFMVTCFTFALYIFIDHSHQLTAQKAFVSVALFNLLRVPLNQIPNMMTNLILTLVSVKRLNKFLNSDEIVQYVEKPIDQSNSITMTNASFDWFKSDDGQKSGTLSHLNLVIPKGSLVAVVGSVGSGKSSLLAALLGEMQLLSGKVTISADQRVAYVSQQAWIQNCSLRNNILFGSDYEQQKYDRIIEACALGPDLEILTAGDETEIGEKGVNLSGGQKQRVAIARACYFDADLYLLDDPLSAVDSQVGKHIFNNVFNSQSGILRGKTRILVTNSLYMLSSVDQIVLLKGGEIEAAGTYQELMENSSNFNELITNYGNVQNDEDYLDDQVREQIVETTKSTIEIPKPSIKFTENEKPSEQKSKLVEAERIETGQIGLSIYGKYIKTLPVFGSIAIVLFYFLLNASNTSANMWLSVWTSDSETANAKHYLLIYFLIGVTQLVFTCSGWLTVLTVSLVAARSLHAQLIEAIVHAPMHFFDTTPLGRIVNRFSKDIDTVDTQIASGFRVLINTSFVVLSIIFVVAYQTPWFIVFVIPVILGYFCIQRFYVSTSRQLKRLESITRSPVFTHFSETLNGFGTVKAFNATKRFIAEFDRRVDENQRCCYPNFVSLCWLQVWLEFFSNFLIFFASLLAILSKKTVENSEGLNGSQVGLALSYALNITLYLNTVVRTVSSLENNLVSVGRISEYTKVESEAAWKQDDDDSKVGQNWPEMGEICFDSAGARYRPGLDLVLRNVDFSTRKQEKLGIVGRSGAGKSSLTLALFRIIELAVGKIWIDGVDISTLGLHTLRSKLTIIPQDPVLFSGTLRHNLDPFEQYTDEQLWTILEMSHLKAFVLTLPLGLQHPVAEGGQNVSLGQRQLICLARALLRHTKVLVLDDATAAVDFETDALIQSTIRTQFANCTVITIAHRLNTIMDSDRVMVLNAGEVAELDTPTRLLQDELSFFHSLAKDAKII